MDDPDLDPEIARIRSRLTSLEAERAELVSRLAGLERARQDAMSLSPPQVDAAASIRGGNGDVTSGPENRTVPPEICRPDRTSSQSVGRTFGPSASAMPRPVRTNG